MVNNKALQKNLFYFTIGEFFNRLINFIAFIYIARILLVEDYGSINIAIAFVSYFNLAIGFVHDDIATREISKYVFDETSFRNNVFTLRLLLGILLFFLLTIMCITVNLSLQNKSFLFIYGLSILSSALYINWYFRAKENINVIAKGMIFSAAVNLICVILFVHASRDANKAIWIITIKEIVNSLVLLFYYYKNHNRFAFALNKNLANYLLKQSLPLVITAFLILANYNVGLILISAILGSKEAGFYSAAMKFLLLSYIPFAIIYQSFLPQLSKSIKNFESFSVLNKKYAMIVMGLGVIISTVGYIFADVVIKFTYGHLYYYSISLLKFLILTVFINYCSKYMWSVLIIYGRQKLFVIAILLGVIINIISNLILIPKYASLGAVYSSIISEIIILILLFMLFIRFIAPIQLGKHNL